MMNNITKTINNTKSILSFSFKLLKKVPVSKIVVSNTIDWKFEISNIKLMSLLFARIENAMIYGIISPPRYKLLNIWRAFAALPENLKRMNSFSVFTGTFRQRWAKKTVPAAEAKTLLQSNHISDKPPLSIEKVII